MYTLNYSQMESYKDITKDIVADIDDGVGQVITSCWDSKECRRSMDAILGKVKETVPVSDCSDQFSAAFSAGEVFKIIVAILQVSYEKKGKILVQSFTKLGSSGSVLLGGCEREI